MKKQVILLMTDTTRKDMLGCYGNSDMYTPNLDRLAAGGIRYENAYTCQPVCGPARSAIFTGTFPHTNGMVSNSVAMGANAKTIGQHLNRHQIPCGYIGKWHLDGGDYFGFGICPEGWEPEYWYDMKCYLEELSPKDRIRSRNPTTAYEPDFDQGFTYAHRCSDRALRFLEQYQDQDFFLTVSYDEPHGPSLCPEPYRSMYDGFSFEDHPGFHDDLGDKPKMQQLWAGENRNSDPEKLRGPSKELSLFLGCNSFVDYEIGRVLEKVERQFPDALVIYTSDHGDMLGSHKMFSKNAAAYREVANVPLIIRGGAVGSVVDFPASHIDLAPTILEYFGLPIPKNLEGKSMLTQIRDPSVRINDEVYTEFTRYEVDHDGFGGLQIMRAIITDQYKLVVHLLDKDELYDGKKDPYELCNRIEDKEYGEIRNQLHDKLLDHMNKTRDLYRGYQWKVRPWRKDMAENWDNEGFTRQKEEDGWEPRQLDYDTGCLLYTSDAADD